jgi:chitinase
MASFGGIMVWDASQAYGNTQDVLPHYAHGITRLIKGANNTLPMELAPVTVDLSPEGTIVAKSPITTTATSSIATVTSTVTSTLALATVTITCSSLNTRATYSTSDVLFTVSVPNPVLPGQYMER